MIKVKSCGGSLKMIRASYSRSICLLLSLAASAALWMAGCSSEQRPAPSAETSSSSDPNLISVKPEQMSQIKLMTLEPTTMNRVLRLTGSVAYNNFATTPVISQVSGPVLQIMVSPGQRVARGQAMLYASSPEFSQQRSAYLKARDASRVAEQNFSRANDLYQHHAISQKDLLDAESTKNQTQADLQAAIQGLEILGISRVDAVEGAASAKIPLRAPISGAVVERLVAPGQLMQAGNTQCFTISDLSTVWVLVNIHEQDLAYVHDGDSVEIRTESYPTVFRGKISYLGAALDPTSRTLQARIVTANPGEKLKKDMYVVATVQAGAVRNVIAAPDAALLRDSENEPYVYVAAGNNQFARRQVTIGDSENGQTEIKSGLKNGDKVVADGALFLQFAHSLQ